MGQVLTRQDLRQYLQPHLASPTAAATIAPSKQTQQSPLSTNITSSDLSAATPSGGNTTASALSNNNNTTSTSTAAPVESKQDHWEVKSEQLPWALQPLLLAASDPSLRVTRLCKSQLASGQNYGEETGGHVPSLLPTHEASVNRRDSSSDDANDGRLQDAKHGQFSKTNIVSMDKYLTELTGAIKQPPTSLADESRTLAQDQGLQSDATATKEQQKLHHNHDGGPSLAVAIHRLLQQLFERPTKGSGDSLLFTPKYSHFGAFPYTFIVETRDAFFVGERIQQESLQTVQKCFAERLANEEIKLFVLYQLVFILAFYHGRGVVHGQLAPENCGLSSKLWLSLQGFQFPTLEHVLANCLSQSEDDKQQNSYHHIRSPSSVQNVDYAPAPWQNSPTARWVRGEMSNFDYLMFLNHLAGREIRNGHVDSMYHPVLPWVVDFTVQDGGWRDLKKSKFRLKKGDEQLDITFRGPSPHHITEILCDLTYFVYMARRTPVDVLKSAVRSRFVPNEYPRSIRRMYEWTPNECIPEFYTDPTVFVSLHKELGLSDLELPEWCPTPEAFIEYHRKVLESDHVSQSLHHWIDLNFGYKLQGQAAIEAKNVFLSQHDQAFVHRNSGRNGSSQRPLFVQLFSEPHPPRITPRTPAEATAKSLSQQRAGSGRADADWHLARRQPNQWDEAARLLQSDEDLRPLTIFEKLARFCAQPSLLKGIYCPPLSAKMEQYVRIASNGTSRGHRHRSSISNASEQQPQPQLHHLQLPQPSSQHYRSFSGLGASLSSPNTPYTGPVHPSVPRKLSNWSDHSDSRHFVDIDRLRRTHAIPITDERMELMGMDLFALGCIIAELYLGRPLFTASTLLLYQQGLLPPLHQLPRRVQTVVSGLISLNPAERPSAASVLQSSLFPQHLCIDVVRSFLEQFQNKQAQPSSACLTCYFFLEDTQAVPPEIFSGTSGRGNFPMQQQQDVFLAEREDTLRDLLHHGASQLDSVAVTDQKVGAVTASSPPPNTDAMNYPAFFEWVVQQLNSSKLERLPINTLLLTLPYILGVCEYAVYESPKSDGPTMSPTDHSSVPASNTVAKSPSSPTPASNSPSTTPSLLLLLFNTLSRMLGPELSFAYLEPCLRDLMKIALPTADIDSHYDNLDQPGVPARRFSAARERPYINLNCFPRGSVDYKLLSRDLLSFPFFQMIQIRFPRTYVRGIFVHFLRSALMAPDNNLFTPAIDTLVKYALVAPTDEMLLLVVLPLFNLMRRPVSRAVLTTLVRIAHQCLATMLSSVFLPNIVRLLDPDGSLPSPSSTHQVQVHMHPANGVRRRGSDAILPDVMLNALALLHAMLPRILPDDCERLLVDTVALKNWLVVPVFGTLPVSCVSKLLQVIMYICGQVGMNVTDRLVLIADAAGTGSDTSTVSNLQTRNSSTSKDDTERKQPRTLVIDSVLPYINDFLGNVLQHLQHLQAQPQVATPSSSPSSSSSITPSPYTVEVCKELICSIYIPLSQLMGKQEVKKAIAHSEAIESTLRLAVDRPAAVASSINGQATNAIVEPSNNSTVHTIEAPYALPAATTTTSRAAATTTAATTSALSSDVNRSATTDNELDDIMPFATGPPPNASSFLATASDTDEFNLQLTQRSSVHNATQDTSSSTPPSTLVISEVQIADESVADFDNTEGMYEEDIALTDMQSTSTHKLGTDIETKGSNPAPMMTNRRAPLPTQVIRPVPQKSLPSSASSSSSSSSFLLSSSSSSAIMKSLSVDVNEVVLASNYRGSHHSKVWHLKLEARYIVNAHQQDITWIEAHPYRGFFATSSRDGLVKIWTLRIDSSVLENSLIYSEHGDAVSACKLLYNSPADYVASYGRSGLIHVWDVERGRRIRAISVSDSLLPFGGNSSEATNQQFDGKNGGDGDAQPSSGLSSSFLSQPVLSPPSAQITSTNSTATHISVTAPPPTAAALMIQSPNTSSPRNTTTTQHTSSSPLLTGVPCVEYAPHLNSLLVGTGVINNEKAVTTPSLCFLDLSTGKTAFDWKHPTMVLGNNFNSACSIQTLAINPSSRWIASGLSSGYVCVFDERSGIVLHCWKAHDGPVTKVMAYQDGFILSSGADRTVCLWNINGSEPKMHLRLTGATATVNSMVLHHDDLLCSHDNRIGVASLADRNRGTITTASLKGHNSRSPFTGMSLFRFYSSLLVATEDGKIIIC